MKKVIKEYFEMLCYSMAIGIAIAGLLICCYVGTIQKSTTIKKSNGVIHTFVDIYRWETDIFGNKVLVDHDVAIFGKNRSRWTGKLIL